MKILILSVWIFLVAAGCHPEHRFEIDLTKVDGFAWDGKVHIIDSHKGLFRGRTVDRLELREKDGRVISVLPSPHGAERPSIELIGDPQMHDAAEVKVISRGLWWTPRRAHVPARWIRTGFFSRRLEETQTIAFQERE